MVRESLQTVRVMVRVSDCTTLTVMARVRQW